MAKLSLLCSRKWLEKPIYCFLSIFGHPVNTPCNSIKQVRNLSGQSFCSRVLLLNQRECSLLSLSKNSLSPLVRDVNTTLSPCLSAILQLRSYSQESATTKQHVTMTMNELESKVKKPVSGLATRKLRRKPTKDGMQHAMVINL